MKEAPGWVQCQMKDGRKNWGMLSEIKRKGHLFFPPSLNLSRYTCFILFWVLWWDGSCDFLHIKKKSLLKYHFFFFLVQLSKHCHFVSFPVFSCCVWMKWEILATEFEPKVLCVLLFFPCIYCKFYILKERTNSKIYEAMSVFVSFRRIKGLSERVNILRNQCDDLVSLMNELILCYAICFTSNKIKSIIL